MTWFRDKFFRKLIENASILVTGNIITAAIDLVSLAIAARILGPQMFGVLVLAQTYTRFVDQLLNFQSWQALIKYGADSLTANRDSDFRALIKFGFSLDAVGSIVGTLVALSIIFFASQFFAWDELTIDLAKVYSLTILFHLVSTPTAVLRLFSRFHTLAWQRVISASIRMVALIVVWFAESGVWVVFAVWMAAQVLDYLILLALGWMELRRQGYGDVLSTKMGRIGQKFSGIWGFVTTTNLSSAVRLGARELDVLIVGGVMGAAAAGIYKVAKQFASIPLKFSDPLQQAVYPDIARLWAENRKSRFRNTIIRVGVLCGLGGIAMWGGFFILGNWMLNVTVGAEYSSAYVLLLAYMAGVNVYMFGVAFRPAVLSMGHPQRILQIYVVATVAYLAMLAPLLNQFDLIGVAIANMVFHSTWFLAMALSIRFYLRADTEAQR